MNVVCVSLVENTGALRAIGMLLGAFVINPSVLRGVGNSLMAEGSESIVELILPGFICGYLMR